MVETGVRNSPYKTVVLSGEDVEDVKRVLTRLAADSSNTDGSSPANDDPLWMIRKARGLLRERQTRYEIFGNAMFGEPAWDMLLLLYALQMDERLTSSRLVDLSGASKSTGLRWLDYLERQRWIRREEHPTDKRTAFIELTVEGRKAIEAYLTGTSSV